MDNDNYFQLLLSNYIRYLKGLSIVINTSPEQAGIIWRDDVNCASDNAS